MTSVIGRVARAALPQLSRSVSTQTPNQVLKKFLVSQTQVWPWLRMIPCQIPPTGETVVH